MSISLHDFLVLVHHYHPNLKVKSYTPEEIQFIQSGKANKSALVRAIMEILEINQCLSFDKGNIFFVRPL